jgi:hypothetical protein
VKLLSTQRNSAYIVNVFIQYDSPDVATERNGYGAYTGVTGLHAKVCSINGRATVKQEIQRVPDATCFKFWSPPANRWDPWTPSSLYYGVQLQNLTIELG